MVCTHGWYICVDVHSTLVCVGMLMCGVYVDALAYGGLQLMSDVLLNHFPLSESGVLTERTAH